VVVASTAAKDISPHLTNLVVFRRHENPHFHSPASSQTVRGNAFLRPTRLARTLLSLSPHNRNRTEQPRRQQW
jgi:hypothetical protein